MKIVVIIPTYNELENVRKIIPGISWKREERLRPGPGETADGSKNTGGHLPDRFAPVPPRVLGQLF